jgi:hypothetical protein
MQWVLGALGIVVTMIGGIFGVGKLLSDGLDHNFRTCPCAACQRRRNEAWTRQRGSGKTRLKPPSPNDMRSGWYPTNELRTGHAVVLHGRVYDVGQVNHDSSGYHIELRNRHTRQWFVTTVALDLGGYPMWQPTKGIR